MAETTLVQLRVPGDLLARIDEAAGESTRTAWLLGLAERELDDAGPDEVPAPDRITYEVPPDGIPSAGVLCMWQRCGARDTRRYGVTDPAELARRDYGTRPRNEDSVGLALCPAHAALLGGLIYRRPHVERARQPVA